MRRSIYGYIEPILQSFISFNRGDMIAPSGKAYAPLANAAVDVAVMNLPQPGQMHVHSIPISYANPKNKNLQVGGL